MTLQEYADALRAAGVRRAVRHPGVNMFAPTMPLLASQFTEVELFDLPERTPATEPAPPGEDPLPLPEDKPPGSCAAPGCLAKAGFHFAPAYCEQHGLAEFGVVTK